MRLATSYLKEDNLREAAVWFTLLKEVSPLYQDDAVYNLAYIDYVEKRYDKALKSFQSLQNDAVYAALVPYYIGEIYLVKGNYQQARTVAKAYLEQYPAILDENLLDEYRKILKAFYGVLKSADRYLRFVFLTGVTKFAQVSVFSDLNQLNDISMKSPYAALCGITREELQQTFLPELERLAKRRGRSLQEVIDLMECQYDGYHFHPEGAGMFNPFSVLNAFDAEELGYYWFQTGTPTYPDCSS